MPLTRRLTSILAVVAVLVVAGLGYWWLNTRPDLTKKTVYTDATYRFKMSIPTNYIFYSDDHPSWPSATIDGKLEPSVHMTVERQDSAALHESLAFETEDSEPLPATNLQGAYITISVYADRAEQVCQLFSPTVEAASPLDKQQINGQTFYSHKTGGATAGSGVSHVIYRSWSEQKCYEFITTLVESNIGNYDPATVTAIDAAAIQNEMDDIVRSVKLK